MTDGLHEKVVRLSANLARVSASQVQEAIFSALAQIGEKIKADRAYMFAFSEPDGTLDNVLEWCAAGIPREQHRNRNIPCSRYPWLMHQLRHGPCLAVDDVASLPAQALMEKSDLQDQQIRSMLLLPLKQGHQLFGFIGFDSVRGYRQWPDGLQRDLSLVADIIGGALQRESASLELAQAGSQLRKLMQPLPGMVFQYEVDSEDKARMPFVSERLQQFFGLDSETLRSSAGPLLKRIHDDDYARVMSAVNNSRQALSPFREEFRMLDGNNRTHWFEGIAIPERAADSVVWHGYLNEVTERVASEQTLIEQGQWTQTILNNIDDAIFSINEEGIIQSVNRSAERVFDYSAQQLSGQNIHIIMPEPYRSEHDGYLQRYLQSNEPRIIGRSRELEGRRRDGSTFPIELQVSQLTMNGHRYFIGVIRDITERKQSESRIEQLAYYDPLTGLPNRRLLADRIQHALNISSTEGTRGALLFLDLDNFKNLNDSFGHSVGDSYLVQFAQRIGESVPGNSTIARIGGDEFVVLLSHLSMDAEHASNQVERILDRVRLALTAPYRLGSHDYQGSFSIGITLFYDHAQTWEDLLKRADIALHEAKEAGRNTIRFFTPQMQRDVEHRVRLEGEIRKALTDGQFELHYQPQVIRGAEVAGVEALVRWRHPQDGWISPGQFIPVCEDSGLILELGAWVVETACQQLADWSRQVSTQHLIVAVNISARQFHQPDFVDQVIHAIKRTGAPPQQLELELTESLLVQDIDDVINKMESLRQLGVRFSLDDFGTGYSSLAYLKRLPFDQLKIDKSFVQDLLDNENDLEIARMIVALANTMQLEVIAEGVETWPQCHALADMGCYRYQGFLFARPVPPDHLLQTRVEIEGAGLSDF